MASIVGMRSYSLSPETRRRGFSGTVHPAIDSKSLSTNTPTTTTNITIATANTFKFAIGQHEEDDSSCFLQFNETQQQKRVSPKVKHVTNLGPIPWTSTSNDNDNSHNDNMDKPHRRVLSSSVFDMASHANSNNSRLSKSPIKKSGFVGAGTTTSAGSPINHHATNFQQSRLLLETSFHTSTNSPLNTSRGVSFQNPYSPQPMNKSNLQQDQETSFVDNNNNNNLENTKKREHEKTFLVYVKQLKSDLDHERNLVKQLLTQEREFQQEKEAISKERIQHRTEMKQMTDKLFIARREADIKERDLQKALNDMQAWRRLAEESRVRERELEYELIQARKHRLQIKRSQFVQKMMFIVGRKTTMSKSSASVTSKRQMFEQMNAEMDRLQKENSRLNTLLLEKRKSEQFEWSKNELLFASKSLVEFNLEQDHVVADTENESNCVNVKRNENERSNNKRDLEESLVRSFQDKHIH